MPTTTINDDTALASPTQTTFEAEGSRVAYPWKGTGKHVVVIGGGVSGLTAAYELQRHVGKQAEILLVSDTEHFILGQALLGVAFGQQTAEVGFAIPAALAKHHIGFLHASVEKITPDKQTLQAGGHEIAYDYMLIATGPAVDGLSVPGVGGQFNASYSIHSEAAAMNTRVAIEGFLKQPGSAVIALAPGASYLSAAYEFVLCLDFALRQRGNREQATLTFVTPEARFGYLGVGTPRARRLLQRRFADRNIKIISGQEIARVDREQVYLRDGRTLPSTFTLVIPAFHGVPDIWKSSGLTDTHGYVSVNAEYRHNVFPEIYAVGVAAQADLPSPKRGGLPKTGYLSAATAKIAARNIAAAMHKSMPRARSLPRILDIRILDGLDTGVLLLSAGIKHPARLALPLPWHTAHMLKRLLNRYVLWQLRSGRTL